MKPNSKILLILLFVFIGVNQLFGQVKDTTQNMKTTRGSVPVYPETSDMTPSFFTKWYTTNLDGPTIGNSAFVYEQNYMVNVGEALSSQGTNELLRVHGRFSLMDRIEYRSMNANITWGDGNPGKLVFVSNGSELQTTEVMTLVGEEGTVGIGTSTPSSALEVVSTGGQNSPSIICSGNERNNILIVPFLGEGGLEQKASYNYLAHEGDAGIFWTDNEGAMNSTAGFVIAPNKTSNSGVRIDKQGNVGIGVKSPMGALHVSGQTITEYLRIYDAQNPPEDGYVLLTDAEGNARWSDVRGVGLWQLNSNESDIYYNEGNVSVGTNKSVPGYLLAVNGKIISEEILVEYFENWPDFVFEEDYNLASLDKVEEFININNHLPGVPSEQNVNENGVALGEMNAILLLKIEELTLYTIEQQKMIEQQYEMLSKQQKMIEELSEKMKNN